MYLPSIYRGRNRAAKLLYEDGLCGLFFPLFFFIILLRSLPWQKEHILVAAFHLLLARDGCRLGRFEQKRVADPSRGEYREQLGELRRLVELSPLIQRFYLWSAPFHDRPLLSAMRLDTHP